MARLRTYNRRRIRRMHPPLVYWREHYISAGNEYKSAYMTERNGRVKRYSPIVPEEFALAYYRGRSERRLNAKVIKKVFGTSVDWGKPYGTEAW